MNDEQKKEIYEKIQSLTYDECENLFLFAEFVERASKKIELKVFIESCECIQKLIEDIRLTCLEKIDGKRIHYNIDFSRLFSVKYASCKIRRYFDEVKINKEDKHKYNSICLNLFRKFYEITYKLNADECFCCRFKYFLYSSFVLKIYNRRLKEENAA